MTKNLKASLAAQVELDVETQEERDRVALEQVAERRRQLALFVELMGAIESATIAMGGTKQVAGALDTIWGAKEVGRGVSESTYRACLADDSRNYFRVEWIIELATHPGVAEVLRRIADGRAEIEADEELENVYAILGEQLLNPKQAEAIRRKAKAMRRRRGAK